MEKLKPCIVDVARVKPMEMGGVYESRMILDPVITGRDNVIQINHGTVIPGASLPGAAHEDDEIYYVLGGRGRLQLDEEVHDIHGGMVVFIPAGVFHALDNRDGDQELTILTFWRDWRMNEAYMERLKVWGKSFKTIDED